MAELLNRLVRQHGALRHLFPDNGAAFTEHLVNLWAYHHGTRLDFSRLGKPPGLSEPKAKAGETLNIRGNNHKPSEVVDWRNPERPTGIFNSHQQQHSGCKKQFSTISELWTGSHDRGLTRKLLLH
ncbi:transposase family protein [Microvirga sp. 17 mud 1-3]|uniref:transposase family protein n=1 Tax=Microvirga sp. 17 mud 1-3 TaxID=2082949 RepID=UPI0013A53DF9|nr:transposase family protein [Microvirga sp. 17 mud 1-3]